MLGLGWTEMLVIGLVALIVIGPKDLPVVMGKAGKIIGQIQRMGRDFQREINKSTGLDEVRNLRSTISSPLKKTADEIRREFNAIGTDGQHKPTGALKQSDPKVESVVDDIRAKAGMVSAKGDEAPAPAPSGPIKAAKPAVAMSSAATSDIPAQAESAAPPVTVVEKRPKARKAAASGDKPVRAAKPKANQPADATAAKPARKPRKAAAPAIDAEGAPADKPKKPRAPRKTAADTAGNT